MVMVPIFFITLTFKPNLSLNFISQSILIILLILISFWDIRYRIIPDFLTLPGILIGVGFSFFSRSPLWFDSFLGIIVGGGVLFLMGILGKILFKKESMGGGDVKLASMIGAFLGWKAILLTLFLSAFLGTIVGLLLISFSAEVRKTHLIPFAPFLAVSAILISFFGDILIQYMIGVL